MPPWPTLRSSAKGGGAAVYSWAKLYATSESKIAKPTMLFASFPVNHSIPRNAASRPMVIDKDRSIKSLGSMSRDDISTARLHLKMVFAHGPALVGRQRCMG